MLTSGDPAKPWLQVPASSTLGGIVDMTTVGVFVREADAEQSRD